MDTALVRAGANCWGASLGGLDPTPAEGPTSVAREVSSSLICSHWSPDTVTVAKS